MALEYEDFADGQKKGVTVFNAESGECVTWAERQTESQEGSRRGGQKYLESRANYLACMKTKGWIRKEA